MAARVDGEAIAGREVERFTSRFERTSGRANDRVLTRRIVLDYLIRLEYLTKAAATRGIEPQVDSAIDAALDATSPEDFQGSDWRLEDLETAAVAGSLSEQMAALLFPEIAVSEEEVVRRYTAVAPQLQAGWTEAARAAFFLTDATARQLVAEAPTTGEAFDAAAQRLGAVQAGSMGQVTSADDLGQGVLDILSGLGAGQISPEPLQASGGFVVFFVETRADNPARTLDDVRDKIEASLVDAKRQNLFNEWLDKSLQRSKVSVHTFYGRWDKKTAAVL